MKQDYVIQNLLGLHVKPSKLIAQAAEGFDCDITLTIRDKSANAKKMIEILKLGAKNGETITLITTGHKEEEAQRTIGMLLSQGIESPASKI
jgi:phosphotransferase system HPr (HPr) family protein